MCFLNFSFAKLNKGRKMKTINNIELFNEKVDTSIALGTFDGVHLAHQAVINEAVNSEYTPAVFTFNQSPSGIINGEKIGAIATKETKAKLLENLGIKLLFCPDFLSVKDLSPEDFVKLLKEKLGAKKITCGFNFRFGLGGKGNPQILKQLCKKNKIELKVIPPILVGDEPVSSTRIRKYIENGELEKARELLGHNFSFEFEVTSGNHLGSTWDIPTINQVFPNNFIVPKKGVYASKTIIDGKEYKSITNIGLKPTVGSDNVSAETNIFDFSGDLYGAEITVVIYYFIRPERKFEDLEELKRAILNDIDYVKNMIY